MTAFRASGRRSGPRFLVWRVALLALAAGVWIGAVTTDRPGLTGISIALLVVAIVLGLIARES